jgi:hypothetical protein
MFLVTAKYTDTGTNNEYSRFVFAEGSIMSGIRRVSDLGSKGVSSILDGSIQAADFAEGIITGSGHSNIFSNSLSSSTATVVSATRTYQNKQYFFNNLTFNMPSNANTDASDWTAPSGSDRKWSYIYIRLTDNKFFISNNAPSTGENYRFIGGSLCLYLFPAYTSSTNMLNFQLDDKEFYIASNSARISLNYYNNGINLVYVSGLNYNSGTLNLSSLLPVTATTITTKVRVTCNPRLDAGGTSRRSETIEVQDTSDSWILVHAKIGGKYLKTPTTSGTYFYGDMGEIMELKLSRNNYNFSACRFIYSHDDGVNDGNSSGAWWVTNFTDRSIF